MIAGYRAHAESRLGRPALANLTLAIYDDVAFRLDALSLARRHSAAGNPVFLYEFRHALAPPGTGAPHCAELPFVFGTFADPFLAPKFGTGPVEATLAEHAMTSWAAFAASGVPRGPAATWAAVGTSGKNVNLLGGQSIHEVVPAVTPAINQMWGI